VGRMFKTITFCIFYQKMLLYEFSLFLVFF